MSSIITLNIDKSTKASPLKFFEKFYTEENIKGAYPNYLEKMPDLKNPNAWWGQFPVEVDLLNKTWTIEYQFETSWDESTGSTYETRIKKFTFETEFDNLLRREFLKTIGFLNEKLKNAKNDKSKRDFIKNFVEKCLEILKSIENKNWKVDSDILARPIRSLIRNCYINNEDFCPDQQMDYRIGEILKERESSKSIYQFTGLLPALADEILKIKDSQGNPIIKYKADTDCEKLKLFLSKKSFDLEGGSIKLEGAVGKVYYFLHEIILISGLQLNKAEESKLFMINGLYFVAQRASNNTSKIGYRNELDMIRIEDIIRKNTY